VFSDLERYTCRGDVRADLLAAYDAHLHQNYVECSSLG